MPRWAECAKCTKIAGDLPLGCGICAKCAESACHPLPLSRQFLSRMCQMPFFRGKVEKGAWSASPGVRDASLVQGVPGVDFLGWTFTDKKAPCPTDHIAGLCQQCSNRGLVALGPYEPSRLNFCDKKKRSPRPPACPTRGQQQGDKRQVCGPEGPLPFEPSILDLCHKKRESGPAPTRGAEWQAPTKWGELLPCSLTTFLGWTLVT